MNVFLAGIIQGSKVAAEIHDQGWRERVTRAVTRALPDAKVYDHFQEHPESITYDLPDIRATFAEGNRRAGECDLLIAYVPEASMGTAIEMHEAHCHGAAVVTISPLVTNWVIRAYSDAILPDVPAFEEFAASGELGKLSAARGKA